MSVYKFSRSLTACLLAATTYIGNALALNLCDTHAAEAVESARQAAEQNDAKSELLLARAYRDGCGVTTNDTTAFTWALRAANHGNTTAQTWVGKWLRTGIGTKPDLAASYSFLRKAADKGDDAALAELTYFYFLGVGGVGKDYVEAERLWSLAIDRGGDPERTAPLDSIIIRRKIAAETRQKTKQDAEENQWARETPERVARRAEITAAVNRRFTSDDFNYQCWSYAYQIDGMQAPNNVAQAQYQFDQVRMLARKYEACVGAYRPPTVQTLVPVWPWLLPAERAIIFKLYERGFQIIQESLPEEVRNLQNRLKDMAEWIDIHQQTIDADRRAAEDSGRFWRQMANQLDSVGKSLRPPPKIDIDPNEFSTRVNEIRERNANGAKAVQGTQSAPSTAVLTKEVNTVDARRQSKFAADEAQAQQNMANSHKRAEAAERETNARDQVRTGTPCKPGAGACSVAK